MSKTKEEILTFTLTRDCCTSGQCFYCCDLPYGQRRRVVQFVTHDLKRAKEARENWREYNPTLTSQMEEV